MMFYWLSCVGMSAALFSADASTLNLERMPHGVLIETETCELVGKHWRTQSKLPGYSGKGYLINVRRPVILLAPLRHEVAVPKTGRYTVWVRAFLGGEPDAKPGFHDREFALEVDGKRFSPTHLGTEGNGFVWERAGTVELEKDRPAEILIHDVGRAEAIIDCLLLTDEAQFRPPHWNGNGTRPGQGPFFQPPDNPVTKAKPFQLEAAKKVHVEKITASPRAYPVEVGGTLDEFNTARYTDTYNFSKRLERGFQPNRYVLIENTGDVDVVHPRLVVGGRRDWYSAESILQGILKPDMTDAEKALAIWKFASSIGVQTHDNNRRVGSYYPDDRSHPSRNTFKERGNPVKAANLYYCSGCQYGATTFAVLARAAGLTSRCVWMCSANQYEGHCVAEVFDKGAWRLFDPERRSFYLAADNTTVASYEMLHRHPELAARTHDGGFASKYMGMRSHAPEYERFYPPSVMPIDTWTSTMAMTLRPGEKFLWRWVDEGKYRCGQNPRNRDFLPYRLVNGKIIYRPDLGSAVSRSGILAEKNIKTTAQDGHRPAIHADVAGLPSSVTFKVRVPYPIVGGVVGGRFLRADAATPARILLSIDDSDWTEVWAAGKEETGALKRYFSVDALLGHKFAPVRYECYVKYEFATGDKAVDAGLDDVYLEFDVQMASTSLPSLAVGTNKVLYRDESCGKRRVKITHGWEESSATRPPRAPSAPVSPVDGARLAAAPARLVWTASEDPDGDALVDYHVQVSPRDDFAFPVAPNLDRLTFSGKPEWEMPQGWLVPGRTYYWRVRAQDKKGTWSPWSRPWRFTAGGGNNGNK